MKLHLSLLFILLILAAQTGSEPVRISQGMGGRPANGWADSPAVSASGQVIAYVSSAGNLVAGDANGLPDVFVLDRESGKTVRISRRGTEESDGWSYQPAISADGRVAAFTATATNLARGDANAAADVFAYDLETRLLQRVSVASGGGEADGWSEWPSLSADGRLVAFSSLAGNLGPEGDDGGASDIFVHDRQTHQTQQVSLPAGGQPDPAWAIRPALSADGRFVAYIRLDGSRAEVVLFDRLGGASQVLPRRSSGQPLSPAQNAPVLSAGAERVVFAGVQGGVPGLFLFERSSGETRRLELATRPRQAGDLLYSLSAWGDRLLYSATPGDPLTLLNLESGKGTPMGQLPPGAPRSPEAWRPALSGGASAAVFVGPGEAGQPAETSVWLLDLEREPALAALGWAANARGEPLAGVKISAASGESALTGRDGRFRLEGLPGEEYSLRAQKKGYTFSPPARKGALIPGLGAVGLAFTAAPTGILEAARQDLGMPYALTRGCPSPYYGCGGPFHGFYSGDCTDLVLDAYREGAAFDIQLALQSDFSANPDHYYRWRDARGSQDMWRYFAYTGQLLPPEAAYLPGDIVFFDWERDGVTDHVALVSEVSAKGRPRRMLDATGKIAENPGGLATELEWKPYHDTHTQGHARWSGSMAVRSSGPGRDLPRLLVSLDGAGVSLKVLDLQARSAGEALALGAGQLVRLLEPPAGQYVIEIRASQAGAYQLGLQTVQDGVVTKEGAWQQAIAAGETQRWLVQVTEAGGKLVFSTLLGEE